MAEDRNKDDIKALTEALSQASRLDGVDGVLDSYEKEGRERQKKTNRAFSYGGAGKRKFVIESSNWGASLGERRGNGYEIGASRGVRRDKVRDAAGKYWGYDKGSSDSGKSPSAIFISKGRGPDSRAKVPFSMWASEPKVQKVEGSADERNPFFEVKQVVVLRPDKNAFKDKNGVYRSDNWRTLIQGFSGENATGNSGLVDLFAEYDYLAFDMQLPFSYSQLEKLNIAGPHYARIRPEYNFYIKKYEEMIRFGAGRNQPETIFPNLYALMMEKINETSNKDFANHISLADTLAEGEATVGASNKNKFDIKKHSGQYFDLYGMRFSKAVDEGTTPTLSDMSQKYKNIVVPVDNVSLLRELSEKKELFPMFVDMEFSTDKMTEFAQMLSETNLTDDFMWSMVKDVASSSGFENINFTEVVETSNVEVQEDGTSIVKKTNQTRDTTRRVWNVFSWLQKSSLVNFSSGLPFLSKTAAFDAAVQETTAIRRSIFLDDGSVEDNLLVDPKKKFFKSLLGVIFVGKLKTFLKNRFRTYDEMIEGHTCHSESVLYRVEKTLADTDGSPTGKTIQNFWFPNTNQIDVLNLIDTQLKYGKRYAYKIYAYQLAVNTKYSYTDLHVGPRDAYFVVSQKPEALLIEQEIFLDDQTILDDPPVPPEVEIVPYFGNGRKLLFNMKSAVGEYLLDPIILNLEDVGQHDDVRKAQKLGEGDKIRFKSDDKAASFEIYRIEEHPSSWTDFDNRLLAAVSNKNASTGEYVDDIRSNRKYYYTCRAVDVHGHVSNPTDIWEVELVNDEGSVYMKKRIVDFVSREPKHPAKAMRRLLQIRPATEQTFINTSDAESALDVKNIKLGHLQESPWGRRFKFRVVSKKTGKKMDFNVNFKATMDRRSTLK